MVVRIHLPLMSPLAKRAQTKALPKESQGDGPALCAAPTRAIKMSLKSTYLLSSQYLGSALWPQASGGAQTEYLFIFFFLVFSVLISCLVFGLSYCLSARRADKEKVSAYECGFNPFEDARNQFDVRFYLVAILFIIFDLEVSFLFP